MARAGPPPFIVPQLIGRLFQTFHEPFKHAAAGPGRKIGLHAPRPKFAT
jgi:hypothetical protein